METNKKTIQEQILEEKKEIIRLLQILGNIRSSNNQRDKFSDNSEKL